MEIQMKKDHLGWVDLLRVIACFLVVLSHCCDPFVARFDADRGEFLVGVFSGSLFRSCVPLFVMMTGVLLLPVNEGMAEFYKKRIGRIISPLVFWSVALPVLFFLYYHSGVATNNPLIVADNYAWGPTFAKVWTFVFNFNFDTTPLWYLYMLIGLYLVMPVISSWMRDAPRKDVRLFLYIWGVTLVLPYVKMAAPLLGYAGNYGNMGILGVCDWNDYGTFYYCSGFIGYLVLAYYLVKYPPNWSWKRTLWITVPMFLAGYLITSFGFVLTQEYFPGNYANLEIVWYFAGINVFMMTFPIFVIVQKMKVPSSGWMSRMAAMTFGIYLCHYIFVEAFYDFFDAFVAVPVILKIAGMAVLAFFTSYLVSSLMDRFKLTRRFIR